MTGVENVEIPLVRLSRLPPPPLRYPKRRPIAYADRRVREIARQPEKPRGNYSRKEQKQDRSWVFEEVVPVVVARGTRFRVVG